MTGPTFQRGAMVKAGRRRSFPVHPGAAALALSAALAIPALTAASGSATAATAARAAPHKVHPNQPDAGQALTGGTSAASRTVLAWGRNTTGQLGDGTTTSTSIPVKVHLPAGTKVTQVRAGCADTLALTANGQVLAWGDNDSGELGNGSTASSDVPVRAALPAGVRATAVSAEEETSLARTSGGGLFGWGDNSLGQLGDGTTTSSDTPVSIPILLHGPSLGHLVSLFGGCGHTVALFSSGKVLAWGSNVFGQLGDGTTTGSDTPVAVMLPASAKVTAISAGCATSYALTRNGHMLAWGLGAIGELGDGSTTSSDTPVRVDLPSGWRASAVGSGPMAAHALAIVHKEA